eukprot:TRINITY_DN884_c0_g1_i2.p2 TRINITY_DN884_c0_g1~~TRINITY_DN884_c0_g1_i2.p2  ORF type:complete len:193 (+),score=27.43 TRINITY_DN884_c0_g1_i2:28-579(+)
MDEVPGSKPGDPLFLLSFLVLFTCNQGHATCAGMFGTGSYCNNSFCMVPCTNDTTCYIGTCSNNFCQYDTNASKSEILLQFSKCLLDRADSKLSSVIIDDLVAKSNYIAPHHQLLYEELSAEMCNFPGPQFGTKTAGTYYTEQQCVDAAWCPTLSCIIGSTDWCTTESNELQIMFWELSTLLM